MKPVWTGRMCRWAGVAACAASLSMGWIVMVPAGVALADCTSAGDFGAGAGCPPPDDTSGSGSGESWPPTGVDWPPSQGSNSGSTGAGGKGDASTPIVLPDGQQAPLAASSVETKDTATSTPPTPIVPVGAPVTGPAPSAIVMPTSAVN